MRGLREGRIRTHLDMRNNGSRCPQAESLPGGIRVLREASPQNDGRCRVGLIRNGFRRHLLWRIRPLYQSTGFPQVVQGKRGENGGESERKITIFVFFKLQWSRPEQPVLVAWFIPQNVSTVPSHFGLESCQMVQVRRTGMDPTDRALHLRNERRFE